MVGLGWDWAGTGATESGGESLISLCTVIGFSKNRLLMYLGTFVRPVQRWEMFRRLQLLTCYTIGGYSALLDHQGSRLNPNLIVTSPHRNKLNTISFHSTHLCLPNKRLIHIHRRPFIQHDLVPRLAWIEAGWHPCQRHPAIQSRDAVFRANSIEGNNQYQTGGRDLLSLSRDNSEV